MAAAVYGRPEMYSVKPIYNDVNVDTQNCMYYMKNLHDTAEIEIDMDDPDMKTLYEKDKKIRADLIYLTDQLKNLSQKLGHNFGESSPIVSKKEIDMDDPDMKTLYEKEKNIRADLISLTNELKNLSQKLGHNFGESSPTVSKKVKLAATAISDLPDGICDFVISVSPSQTALSAVLLGELLKSNGVHVATPTQKHSSLEDTIPSNHLAAMGGLTGRLQQHVEKIILTFVWKSDPFCPSLMNFPLQQTRIIGDANIGRYLCRILCPQLYDENDIDHIAAIDKWIDVSVQMTNGNSKEKNAAMKSMNSHLGKNDLFCGQNITLADITLFASLLTNIDNFGTIPNNVKKWYLHVSEIFCNTVSKFNVPSSWTVQ